VTPPRFRHRSIARVCAVVSAGLLPLGFAVPDSPAAPRPAGPAASSGAPLCRGRARRLRPGHVSFLFTCGGEDVTAFVVRATRTLHSVVDPSYAFACERSTYRSFDCGDIHSGAGSEGFGLASVSEPLCHRGAHLILRITPTLNFEQTSAPSFELRGPC